MCVCFYPSGNDNSVWDTHLSLFVTKEVADTLCKPYAFYNEITNVDTDKEEIKIFPFKWITIKFIIQLSFLYRHLQKNGWCYHYINSDISTPCFPSYESSHCKRNTLHKIPLYMKIEHIFLLSSHWHSFIFLVIFFGQVIFLASISNLRYLFLISTRLLSAPQKTASFLPDLAVKKNAT